MTPRRESPPCQGFASIQSGRERVLWITMSRAISFFVACNLVALGLVVFYLDVFDATRFQGRLIMMGGLLVAVGGAWLWASFIGPLFGGRRRISR